MKTIIAFVSTILMIATHTISFPHGTDKKPARIPCSDLMCEGKTDGSYEYNYNRYDPNYFVQCTDGVAHCQPCWPNTLEFSQNCNQCLHSKYDQCLHTPKWRLATGSFCPDTCPQYGYHFSGNILDPFNHYQYIACWKGVTIGCITCPSGLKFNEQHNACLYEGKYITEPSH